LAEELRGCTLEALYQVIFFYALQVNICDEVHVSKKAVYLALAIQLDNQKELLWVCGLSGTKALNSEWTP
jgi:putative transposase